MQSELMLIFGTALVILLWRCASKLSTIVQQNAALIDSTRQLSKTLADSSVELHAVAAHFVPRLRTENDISEEQRYVEARQMGFDCESTYLRKLDKEGG